MELLGKKSNGIDIICCNISQANIMQRHISILCWLYIAADKVKSCGLLFTIFLRMSSIFINVTAD